MTDKPTGQSPNMGWETRSGAQSDDPPPAPGEAFHQALARLGELREYVSYLISAKADALKSTLRSVGTLAVLGLLGAVAGATFVVVASTLLLTGAAHGLGVLFGDRPWLGELVVGVVVLAAVMVGAFLGLRALTGASRKKTVEKYETRQHQQRRQYGHDVEQRAHEQSSAR